MLDDDIVAAAKKLLDICRRKNLTLATAESCTAGLVAGTLSEVPGVSSMLERGFITYSNQAKQEMLGVPAATLNAHGAVSRETAEAMAKGALAHAPEHADLLEHGALQQAVTGPFHVRGEPRDERLPT